MVTKNIEATLIWIFVVLVLVGTFVFIISPESFDITGRIASGYIGLTVLEPVISLAIDSPENITYNFGIGADYNIDLNVTADFEPNTWWYDLYDLRHSTMINESVIFTPNTTITAVRWSNQLTVYANHTVGTETSDVVTFFVSVPNSAPVLGDINNSILVCENNTLSHYFNATDVDENPTISVDINPKDPFYVSPNIFQGGQTFVQSYIISDTFSKSDLGVHSETISVSDQEYVDTTNVNITVIEINNPPVVSEIGAQTAWTTGNATFYKEVIVNDVENGNQDSGNLSFVLTFLSGEKFFDITELFNIYILNFVYFFKNIQNYSNLIFHKRVNS